jgi:DNA-directed RNA polymerase subunit RPC12/RpoP
MSEPIEIEKDIVVTCPHCKDLVLIEKLNCRIFRHGYFTETKQQMHAHTPKEVCDYLFENKKIYGCGKPFEIIQNNEGYLAIICDYK